MDHPWDLQTAFSQPAAVKPGDVIWLRGGTYRGTFTSKLKGQSDNPIVVRQYPGERPILDGDTDRLNHAVLSIHGEWAWYWGFEVTNSSPNRVIENAGSNPDDGRAIGVDIYGPNTKAINLIVHDNGNGFGFWTQAENAELYGNIVYYNGWQAPDRGHGQGVYSQNQNGVKRLADNVFFKQFDQGIQIYGSEDAHLDNYELEGNIVFSNGLLSNGGATRNILLGGGRVAQNVVLADNYTYFAASTSSGQNNLGYRAGCNGVILRDNYMTGGGALVTANCSNLKLDGNFFYPYVFGFEPGSTNTYVKDRPAGVKVFVRPNRYEGGRANIAIYNWDMKGSVNVNLSNVLKPGDVYEVRDAQNYFDAPVASGTYNGGPVTIPMRLTKVTAPVGAAPVAPVHTSPEFGVFVVMRTSASPVDRGQPPIRTH